MLFLNFQIGDEGYALATDRIVEILPLLDLKKARHAPAAVAGSFDYRGRFVPVIDLCELELARPARRWLSTRIIMVRLTGDSSPFGLIAEHATETLRREPSDFAPFAIGPRGLIQRVELETLLPPPLLAFVQHDLVDSQ